MIDAILVFYFVQNSWFLVKGIDSNRLPKQTITSCACLYDSDTKSCKLPFPHPHSIVWHPIVVKMSTLSASYEKCPFQITWVQCHDALVLHVLIHIQVHWYGNKLLNQFKSLNNVQRRNSGSPLDSNEN